MSSRSGSHSVSQLGRSTVGGGGGGGVYGGKYGGNMPLANAAGMLSIVALNSAEANTSFFMVVLQFASLLNRAGLFRSRRTPAFLDTEHLCAESTAFGVIDKSASNTAPAEQVCSFVEPQRRRAKIKQLL